jgi:hypothetical protein
VSAQVRQSKVDELVRKLTALGHYVRSEPGLDENKVKRLRREFEQARASATEAEQKAAWKIAGRPPQRS